MNTQDQFKRRLLQRYAWLATGVERTAAQGGEVPPEVVNEMSGLWARGSAIFTPAEQQSALGVIDSLKAQYHQQAEVKASQAAQRDSAYYTDRLAREATGGLTYEQMQKAAKGEKFQRKAKRAVDVEGYGDTIAGVVKVLGKPDMTRKQFEKVADRYHELKSLRGDERANDFLKAQFGDKASQARPIIKAHADSGIDFAVALAERRGQDSDHYIEPTEDLQLRAELATAWAEVAATDEATREHLASADSIDPSYLEDEGSQGDVARAMAQLEAKHERKERQSYTPETYSVEDQDDVRISAY